MSRTATFAPSARLDASPLQAWLVATANLLAAAFTPAPRSSYLDLVPAAASSRLSPRALRLMRSGD
jgi:hypothetical protein